MPLYEYQCDRCGRFEIIRKFSDAGLEVCPTCGGAVEKLPSSPAIQFKGTGWYVTDYGRKSSGGEGKGEGKKDEGKKDGEKPGSGEAKASSGGSEAKGESKDSSASSSSTSKDGASGGTSAK